MRTIEWILLGGLFISVIFTIAGMIRPGFAVLWNKSNTRGNVAKVWGVISIIFLLAYFIYSGTMKDSRKTDEPGPALDADGR